MAMCETRAIVVWMGGVVVDSVVNLVSKALSETSESLVNPFGLPGLRSLTNQLATGKIESDLFLRKVCDKAGTRLTPIELETQIVQLLGVRKSICETINLSHEHIERWLVVDWPKVWFDRISDELRSYDCFDAERMIFLPDSRLVRLLPDAFYYISQRLRTPMENCLLLAADGESAVEAINHGLPAATFADSIRLRREFALRQLSTDPHPGHTPALQFDRRER